MPIVSIPKYIAIVSKTIKDLCIDIIDLHGPKMFFYSPIRSGPINLVKNKPALAQKKM